VHRRLLPVYTAVFLQGCVLWYTVEKLFMQEIGFDAAGIGLAVAVVSLFTVLGETPAGILADRWSRRGVLVLSGLSLALASVVGGLSHGVPVYLVCSALSGLHLALASGTSDAIGYELVTARGGQPEDVAAVLGRLRAAEGVALVLSAVAGGLLADRFEPRPTYLLTVAPAVLSVVLLLLAAPVPRPEGAGHRLGRHVLRTFAAVTRDRDLVPVTAVLVVLAVLTYAFLDFVPLWLIALSTPVAWFGPVAAATLAGYAAGGMLGGSRVLVRPAGPGVLCAVLTGAALTLVLTRSVLVVTAAAVLLVVALVALTVRFTGILHDGLGSAVRAGAASAVSTLGRVVLIPFALAFGALARDHSVFRAGWLLVGTAVLASVLTLTVHRGREPGGSGGRDGRGGSGPGADPGRAG
jgi:MFS family permease